ncbi:VOC family protein [Jeotgalibacillus campisalis]|uniref:Glyoxalase n=1 Tax=Jeotgalibacillus campisalis TaxID=220754 RepID=A0A0C2SFW2_9BACL|nr:VOC family protein [Jeotgalibacillus campisalis]KIL52819.1 glyoxalase [Jeotgalibacillus campisalis]
MSFSFQGIDHVQLVAPEGHEEKARDFYSGVLGLREIPKPENLRGRGGCWFACGPQEIHIGSLEPFSAPKKAHPALVVTGLNDLRIHLEGASYTIDEEEPIAGRDRLFVEDPFGNRIEFLEYHAL